MTLSMGKIRGKNGLMVETSCKRFFPHLQLGLGMGSILVQIAKKQIWVATRAYIMGAKGQIINYYNPIVGSAMLLNVL